MNLSESKRELEKTQDYLRLNSQLEQMEAKTSSALWARGFD
jgi:hypothetical protein